MLDQKIYSQKDFMSKDYYEILGVSRSVSEADLKKAYRQLAIKYHPDKNPGDKVAEDRFKEASVAYDVLSNPEKKAIYDQFGADGLQGGAGFRGGEDIFSSFGDIFDEIFGGGGRRGGGRSRAVRGDDLRYDLEIDFIEACYGDEKEIQVSRQSTCSDCDGRGSKTPDNIKTCPRCRGAGQVGHSQGFFTIATTCPQCRGQGAIISDPCSSCQGLGTQKQSKRLSVKIPAGVATGVRLLLQNEGQAGERGGPPGDLYVFIRVRDHDFFHREEENLVCDVHVSMVQAALGTSITIAGLKENHELQIPAGLQSGEKLVLRGQGVPNLRSHRKGDMIIRVHVDTPTKLSSEQKELLEKLAELSGEKISEVSSGKKKKKGFFG